MPSPIDTANAPLAGAGADPMVPRFLRVRRVTRETHDTVTIVLDPPKPRGGPGFAPGQFDMLYLFGAGEVAVSISGDPSRPDSLAHTVRAVGAVTTPLTAIRRGDELGVRGPYGSAWPLSEAARKRADLILIAGGIGLAPLRPVICSVLRDRKSFGRLTLLYGARTPADLLWRIQRERWRAEPDVAMRVVVDRGDREWLGRVGVVTDLLAGLDFDAARTVAMVCGPEVMMRFVARDLLSRGMSADDIHLSLERNMKCAVGLCGHCQFGPLFICKDGPVFRLSRIAPWLGLREF